MKNDSTELFEKMVSACNKEIAERDYNIGFLTKAGWEAFHMLENGQLEAARKTLEQALSEIKTPGVFKDLADATDISIRLLKETEIPSSEDAMLSIASVESDICERRKAQTAELEILRYSCEYTLAMYYELMILAKDNLYESLTNEYN